MGSHANDAEPRLCQRYKQIVCLCLFSSLLEGQVNIKDRECNYDREIH